MKTFIASKLKKLKKDESGATAIEYAVIAGILVVILIVGVQLVGDGGGQGDGGVKGTFDSIAESLPTATPN